MGLTEPQANLVYMVLTAGITLSMLFLGGVPDRIGVRRSLLLSLTIMVVGRFLLAASGSFFEYDQGLGSPMFFVVLAGVLVIVVGYGAYQPAAYAGVKQFTNKKTSAIGYAMIYALMNLGAFVSGIISPPIRHATGMVGVYWVYVAVTILAVLSVVFLLTSKTVKEATARVKREDEEFAREEGGEETAKAEEPAAEKPKEEAAPQRSLAEPLTLGFGLVAAAAVAAFLVQMFTAVPTPAEQLSLDAASALGDGGEAFGKASDPETSDEDFAKAVREAPGKIQAVVSQVLAPEASETLEVVPDAFTLLRHRLATRVLMLSELEELLPQMRVEQSSLLTDEARDEAFRKLRVHAVANMTLAYATVEPVDASIVDMQTLRMKRPDDEASIPVTEDEKAAIITLAGKDLPAMLSGLADRSAALARELGVLVPAPLGSTLGAVLRAESAFASVISREIGEGPSPVAAKMLTDFVVADAMLARSLAHRLAQADEPAEGDESATTVRVGDYVADALNAGAGLLALEETGGVFATAARAPSALRFQAWLLDGGGLYLILGVLFVVLLGWRVLRLRPDHPFHNGTFTFFIFILIPVQTLFAHNWLTLPLYIDRAFAGTFVGDSFEFFSNINPILIFVITPVVAALTARANVYRMMIWGTLVMAAPTFLLVLPASPSLLLLYIFLMSIGEAMWQPRFLQLVAEIAPEGKTGIYMGIAQLPWFLTKLVTAAYAGFFLQAYCPAVGPQNTEFMWLVYGIIAMISPVALILAKGWVGSRITEKH